MCNISEPNDDTCSQEKIQKRAKMMTNSRLLSSISNGENSLPIGQYDGIQYEASNKNGNCRLTLMLNEGKCVRAASGSMVASSGNVNVSAKMQKSMKSLVTGSASRFIELQVKEGNGEGFLILSPTFYGEIRAIKLNGEHDEIFVNGSSFLASIGDINIISKTNSLKNSLVTGDMFKKKCSGKGVVFVAGAASCFEIALQPNPDSKESDNQMDLVVNTDNLVAWSSSLKVECGRAVKSWIGTAISGEGFVSRISGEGSVFIQGVSGKNFASWVYDSKTPPSSKIPLQ